MSAIVADRGAPELAVLDIDMPDMDGLQLLIQLRPRCCRRCSASHLISGRVREHDIEAGRALGATYITKPFVAASLIAAVERSVRTEADPGW